MHKNLSFPALSPMDLSIHHFDSQVAISLNHNVSHIHKECEIYINLGDDVYFEVESRIYSVARGSVVITRPYEYHHCIYPSQTPREHYWITFSADKSEDFLKIFFDRTKGQNNLLVLDQAQLKALGACLETMLDDGTDALSSRIACLQLFQILKQGRTEINSSAEKLPEDLNKALQYMDAHLTEHISVDQIAAAAFVSINTLERHCKSFLGVTPFVLLQKKRLFLSQQYLRDGETVAQAAAKSGFADYSGYIQLFRKHFSMTPLQYKKLFAKTEATHG